MTRLFDHLQLGDIALSNRVIMAPMTRSRAEAGAVPTALMVEYYRQRASAGLIVSEGIAPSPHGIGYCRTPGIYNSEQVVGWHRVTDAVHQAGGRIVAQIMHCGRVGSRLNKPADARTVAPSAVRAAGMVHTDVAGMQNHDLPRSLALEEIQGVVDEYAAATRNALAAGFDGVELHCTSGYLPMQFMATNTNLRTDSYGGSVHNRVRFVIETLEAMVGVAGDRVGMRICPGNPFNDVIDPEPAATYGALLSGSAHLNLTYLHVIRSPLEDFDAFGFAHEHFKGPLILNDGFDGASASQALAEGCGAAISFARHFIGNPDLVRRLREGLPLNDFDSKTLYTPGSAGYTDYPCAPT
ncbi:1,2-oxophytodienoate reductase [Steroidobacter denitrificans]|uniref:1,2-oxophytodienoate reductase n=1 Tax=Steroidobacter denitrificans TaxID=465721 RepID=A0A127F7N8_STEDE|nr:alkene reductase [Steroidobacter denitrificans]AMN45605.1 1,2-oxophytodienoate reductase [Steroidobacter denitrificans]